MSLVFMQVGGKSGMKRGEYRMEDPGEQSVATPVGLSQIPWRKVDILNCFP